MPGRYRFMLLSDKKIIMHSGENIYLSLNEAIETIGLIKSLGQHSGFYSSCVSGRGFYIVHLMDSSKKILAKGGDLSSANDAHIFIESLKKK